MRVRTAVRCANFGEDFRPGAFLRVDNACFGRGTALGKVQFDSAEFFFADCIGRRILRFTLDCARPLRPEMDVRTKDTLTKIPLLTVRAGPRDNEAWRARLKEELTSLIKYVQNNKADDKDWFHVECNPHGTRWTGKCWYYYDQIRYEFELEFEIPVAYPAAAPELKLPQLDGLTTKMYRGGKICQTVHFEPLWSMNVPHFGIAHSLALSLGPWLAAEVPDLVGRGVIERFKK